MAQDAHDYYRNSYALTLRAFCYVAKLQSFTRAANELGIDESTISLQVRGLERDLGVRLFVRRGRGGTALTAEGECLLEIAATIVTGLETLKERFDSRLHKPIGGTVTLAIGEIAARCFLPTILRAARDHCPGVDVTAVHRAGAEIFTALEQHEIDFAFASVHRLPAHIAFLECVRSELCILVARQHPLAREPVLTIEHLARYPFVVANTVSAHYEMLKETLEAYGAPFVVAETVGSFAAVTRCVELGLGIAAAPRVFASDPALNPALAVLPAGHIFGTRGYGILYPRGRGLPPAARAILRVIAEVRPALHAIARGFEQID